MYSHRIFPPYHLQQLRVGERLDINVSLLTRDCRHREVLAAQTAELSPMPLTTAECVYDVVMDANDARKYDLVNAVDISESVDSISKIDPQ